MKPQQEEMFDRDVKQEPIRIYTDGAGSRPDGKGSGYAFLRSDTGEKQSTREDGLTNNQAEYKGVLMALKSLPRGTVVDICSDSEVVCSQLNRRYTVRDRKLLILWELIQEIIHTKDLRVTFSWVPRQENPAGKLL